MTIKRIFSPRSALSSWRDKNGAVMIELAISILLLLLIVFGIVEIGFAFFTKAMVTNAAREGARHAVTIDADNNSIDARVETYLADFLLTGVVTIEIDPTVTPAPKLPVTGTPVTVTVTYNYSPLIPFIKSTPWNITSEAVMRRE